MTIKELYRILETHIKTKPKYCLESIKVRIPIAKHSIGPKASVEVTNAWCGFDWNSDSFFVAPEKDLTPKSENEEIWDDARELLMFIATKPVKKVTYEVRQARRIFERLNIDYMQYQSIFHKED